MKTCSSFLPNQNFIDTAPMIAAYERLTAMTLVMIEQRIGRGFIAHCNKVLKLVRELTRAEWSNHQLDLKLRMLGSKSWRERVLKELGGEAALAAWERRMARFKERSLSQQVPTQLGMSGDRATVPMEKDA